MSTRPFEIGLFTFGEITADPATRPVGGTPASVVRARPQRTAQDDVAGP